MLLTFLFKNFVLPRQLKFKQSVYNIRNIWNFDCHLARTISYLDWDRYEHFRYGKTSNKCLQKVWCGTIQSGIYHDTSLTTIYTRLIALIKSNSLLSANSLLTSHPSQQVSHYCIGFIGTPILLPWWTQIKWCFFLWLQTYVEKSRKNHRNSFCNGTIVGFHL